MSMGFILTLDLGTTGNRTFLFDRSERRIGQAYPELTYFRQFQVDLFSTLFTSSSIQVQRLHQTQW